MGLPRSQPPGSLQGRALRLLAQREHSRAELQRKLLPHVPPDDLQALQHVLDRLQTTGLQSDARAADATVQRRSARLGAARLEGELRAKGLSPDTIAHAMEQLAGSETGRALGVWQKKFGQPPADAREAARQLRFLLGRGFSADVARRVVPRTASTALHDAAGEPDLSD